MADLLSHAAIAFLVGSRRPWRDARPLVVTGTVLPDLLARVPGILFTGLSAAVPGVPEVLRLGWEPFHMPVGMVLASGALALLFRPDRQPRAFAALLGGMLLHLVVDLFQSHMGVGYLLLFPLSSAHFELGLVGSEDSVWVAPLLGLLVGVQLWRELRRGDAGPGPTDED